jgi:hypothetical protein
MDHFIVLTTIQHFASSSSLPTLQQAQNILKQVSDSLFNIRSFTILVVSIAVGSTIGKLFALVIRRISIGIGKRADQAKDLPTVNRLRRFETILILSTALVELICIIIALYFWWNYTHPHEQPTALIGASAIIALIASGVLSPVLRDWAYGGSMLAEQWFGVGDLVTIEPFADMHGIVERVTLRSTKIRGLNGETIWITNQSIAAARVAYKGVHTMALELFVTNADDAEDMIDRVNELLPRGPSLVVSPLAIMTKVALESGGCHITALGETAPGREWLFETNAVGIFKKLDSENKKPTLLTEPIARFADNETERQFARAINNARKTYRPKRRLKLPTV